MMMMMADGDDEVRRSAEMEESPKKWELMDAKIPLFPLRLRQSPNGGILGGEGVGSEKGEPITLSSLVCELDELAGPTAVAAKFPAQLQCIIGRRCINQNLLLFFHNHSSSTLFNAI